MIPEKQHIEIAKACGLDASLCPVHMGYECCGRKIPRFTFDLDACHMMEPHIPEGDEASYVRHLATLMGVTFENQKETSLFYLIHATAAQRCEAFLRTIGKWED